MTDKEIELLIDKVAHKAARCAVKESAEERKKDIELHAAQCAANKYRGLKSLLCAIGGGGVVAAINWLLKK